LARVSNLYADSIATLENFQDAQTQFDVAQQVLEQVAFNKKYARIYAADNGFVMRKLANKGEIIGPGAPFLITNDASRGQGWQITCTINDREWAKVRKGNICRVQVDAYPDLIIAGKVADKSLRTEAVSGAFKVDIAIRPQSIELAVGMYGKAVINTDVNQSNITIPFEALVEANGNLGYVFTPKNDTTVIKRKVRIRDYDKERIVIAEGLTKGEEIVISNSPFLNEYSTIKIVPQL